MGNSPVFTEDSDGERRSSTRQRRKSGRALNPGGSEPPSPAASVASSATDGDTEVPPGASSDWKKVLDDLREHKHAPLLLSHSPDECQVVTSPGLDLGKVRASIDSGSFKTTTEFLNDVALVFLNLIMTNENSSEIVENAQTMYQDFLASLPASLRKKRPRLSAVAAATVTTTPSETAVPAEAPERGRKRARGGAPPAQQASTKKRKR